MAVQRHLCGRQTLTESRKSWMTDRLLFQILFLERVSDARDERCAGR